MIANREWRRERVPASAITPGVSPPEAEIPYDLALDWPLLEDAEIPDNLALDWPLLEDAEIPDNLALDWPLLEDAEIPDNLALDWPDLEDAELADWEPARPGLPETGVREVLKAGRWDR